MKLLNLKDLVQEMQLKSNKEIPDTVFLKTITTDTRENLKGGLFIALSGPNFNGHDFVPQAVDSGAIAVLISEDIEVSDDIFVLKTKDITKSLMDIVRYYKRMLGLQVIAITGSVGKTSTKDMVASVLAQEYKIIKTKENLNNEIGVFKTILSAEQEDEIAVVEVGMCGLGEIKPISMGLEPEIAIITNIGVSHIELLKTQENIFKAKMEVISGMKPGGTLILNSDDKYLSRAKPQNLIVKSCSVCDLKADVSIKNIKSQGHMGSEVVICTNNSELEVFVPIAGKHNIKNALISYCVAKAFGMKDEKIKAGLANFIASGARQKIVKHKDTTYVLDYYNASPTSVFAAMKTLSEFTGFENKVFVLGDMNELGDISEDEHKKVGEIAAKLGVNFLFCVGEKTKAAVEEAKRHKLNAKWFANKETLSSKLRVLNLPGLIVWIKGSRGMKLEEVAQMLGVPF